MTASTSGRDLLWVSLPDQRPRREVYYLSLMPGTSVTALAAERPVGDIAWVPTRYRRPVRRFVEAGALAWARGLRDQDPLTYDWVASLELCSLVTGQASSWRRGGSRGGRTGRAPRQAVITWENLVDQPLYRIPPYRQALESCRDADLLLCMVDAAREHLLSRGFDDERIRVVKPGVDTRVFRPPGRITDRPVVAFVSPLAANKGIDRVLAAMRHVRRSVPDAELVVAGRGPLRSLVERAAADPSTGVRLAGSLDAAGVGDLLRSARVFVTAPRPTWKWEEQFGLAYVEAQACGLPVVTTRCGSNVEALRTEDSFVADDAEAIAAAIVRRLDDPAAAAQEGQLNSAWARAHHDLLRQCARMGEAFADVERLG